MQLIDGMVSYDGRVVEMRAGEDKTLTTTFAAYLNAVSSQGTYVVTANGCLTQRDTEWMGRLYN